MWAAEWLDSDPRKRPKSRERDAGIIKLHLLPTLGHRPLASVTPLDVQRLVATWSQQLAPATTRRHYAVLRAIFAAAVDSDMLGRSPCRRSVKLPTVGPGQRQIVTAAELHRLADAVGPDQAPMVYLAAVLGLRWGECAGLRVKRLDFLRLTVTVAETIGESHGRIVVGEPKSRAGRRTMAVPGPLMDLLAAHLARRGLDGSTPDELVFVAPGRGPLRYRNWYARVWRPATTKAGLAGLGFHELRHAAASAMVAAGVDLRTAQVRLGHSDPRLTLSVYAQASPESDRAAADRLGAHFLGPAEGGEGDPGCAMDVP